MTQAHMTPSELAAWRRMSGLGKSAFAKRLNLGTSQLLRMETGREVIPARLDDEVEKVVDAALWAMDDPGPGPGDDDLIEGTGEVLGRSPIQCVECGGHAYHEDTCSMAASG